MRVSRLWHLLRYPSWEEWTAGLWIGVAPAFFHWYAFVAFPLVLGLIWRGSERRIRTKDAQNHRDSDAYRPHRAVNLLPAEYRDTGTLLGDGSRVLSASTGTKERGTRTPATATTAAFNFFSPPPIASTSPSALTSQLRVSSFTAPGSFGGGTAAPGASGAPRRPAA